MKTKTIIYKENIPEKKVSNIKFFQEFHKKHKADYELWLYEEVGFADLVIRGGYENVSAAKGEGRLYNKGKDEEDKYSKNYYSWFLILIHDSFSVA